MSKNKRSFTFLELLVILGILVVLLTILLPGAHRAQETDTSVESVDNDKRLWTDLTAYAADNNNDFFPDASQIGSWEGVYDRISVLPVLCESYASYQDWRRNVEDAQISKAVQMYAGPEQAPRATSHHRHGHLLKSHACLTSYAKDDGVPPAAAWAPLMDVRWKGAGEHR